MAVVKFWRTEKLTPLDDPETTVSYEPPPPPISLDALVSDIRHTRSRVVTLQCELAKAEEAHEDSKKNFVAAVTKLDEEELCVFRQRRVDHVDDR